MKGTDMKKSSKKIKDAQLNFDTEVLFTDRDKLGGIFLNNDAKFYLFAENDNDCVKIKLNENDLNRLIKYILNCKQLRKNILKRSKHERN